MKTQDRILLATLGSGALLLGAYGFQHLGDLAPCKLCLWQRWPHAIVICIGVVAYVSRKFWLGWLAALITLVGAGIALYHVGVEQKWWQGPQSCSSGGDITSLSSEDLLNQILAAPVTRCDDIVWQFMGLSMAGWNMIISLILLMVWISVARLRV